MHGHVAFLACGVWLLAFEGTQPFAQEVKVETKTAGAPKAEPATKTPSKVEAKKAGIGKSEVKNEPKSPVADLLRAAVGKLFGAGGNAGNRKATIRKAALPGAVAAQQNVEARIKQMEAMYSARLKQVYKSEMHLMRLVCQPSRQQFDKIAAAGEVELKTTFSKYLREIVEQQAGRRLNAPSWQASASQRESRKLISDTILKIARPHLSPEQIARYEGEIAERALGRPKVMVLLLVAGMDRQLKLTPEQRRKITEVLEKNPQKSWNNFQTLMNARWNFPAMPDDKIMPLLTESQKSEWQKVPKSIVYYGVEGADLNWVQGIDFDDEVWNDVGVKK